MVRRYLFIALAVGVMAGFVGLGSALFTDQKSVANNTFDTGTVILSTNPTNAAITFSNMAPGDKVSAPITVSNDGSLQLRYAVTSVTTSTKALNTALLLTIRSGVTTCDNGNYLADGTAIYTGTLGTDTTAANIIGDPTAGSQAGDRTLPPVTSNTEVLCFHVSLPLGTGNAYQGATSTATFAFIAEQTANN